MYSFKKEIWSIFVLVVLLGGFFQINRMDTLLHIAPWKNNAQDISIFQAIGKEQMAREQYLLVYDPADVQSVLTRHIVSKIFKEQKKSVVAVPYYQPVTLDQSCQGVVIATNRLNVVAGMSAIEQYVENGGTAVILRNLQADLLPAGMADKLGVADMGEEVSASGIRVIGSMYLGLQGFGFDSNNYNTSTTDVKLKADAVTELTSEDGLPFIWSYPSGKGKYIVDNCRERDDKNNYGLYTAILSQLSADYIYPVMNMQLYFIDDFPAPVPEGELDTIYQETGLDTADFYRKLWWPTMLDNAEKYNLKYTGLIIESYGDQVKGPFAPLPDGEARNNLIVYGRELLKSGGELGIHGYNHQSLALAGHGQERLGYVPWGSQADMEEALTELKRYINDVYPGYEIHAYVPPSNILSKEGKQALKNVFPEMRVYSSLYNGLATATEYFQSFKLNEDGSCELPRVSSGYIPAKEDVWEAYVTLNYNGVFSHFVHPDEMFYEESKDLTWAAMKQGMTDLLEDVHQRFGWLQPVTASEGADKMEDYFAMDYRVVRTPQGIQLSAWNFKRPLSFVLRTHREISSVEGGTVQKIQADAYLLTVEKPDFVIYWAGEN